MTYKISILFILIIFNTATGCSNNSDIEQDLKKMEILVDIKNFKEPNMYNRYYFIDNGIANGIYIKSDFGHGLIHVVKDSDLPIIMDGGCSIINIKFDLKNKKVLSAFCNGDA